MDGQALQLMTTFETIVCYKCGIQFAVPQGWRRDRVNDHGLFYCPNGHSQHYKSKSAAEKLREELEREKRFHQGTRNMLDNAREQRDRAERSAASYKGKLGHVKKYVANGVCPCCRRSFQNLRKHMETKHPGYGDT